MTVFHSMPLLQGLALLHGSEENKPRPAEIQQGQRNLRSTSSLANLIEFARHPVENVGEAVENWYDGSTKEERIKRQVLADRKQLLYLKLRTVSLLPCMTLIFIDMSLEGNNPYRLGGSSKRAR